MAKKILVVDDDKRVYERIALILGSEIEVLYAENGENALRELSKENPDLVITDVRMPGRMNGVQLTKKIRELSSNGSPKVVVISDVGPDVTADYEEKATRVGASAFLPKSLINDLSVLIQQLLE